MVIGSKPKIPFCNRHLKFVSRFPWSATSFNKQIAEHELEQAVTKLYHGPRGELCAGRQGENQT